MYIRYRRTWKYPFDRTETERARVSHRRAACAYIAHNIMMLFNQVIHVLVYNIGMSCLSWQWHRAGYRQFEPYRWRPCGVTRDFAPAQSW